MDNIHNSFSFLTIKEREDVHRFNISFLSFFDITERDLKYKSRKKEYVFLRAIYTAVLINKKFSYTKIARVLGLENHSSIRNYVKNYIKNEKQFEFQKEFKNFNDYYYNTNRIYELI